MQAFSEARFRNRWRYLLAVVVTISVGLASRRYPQVLPAGLGKYPGDALWTLMVFFGLGTLFRKASSLQLGLGALGFSFAIEGLKLWSAPWLVDVRHTTAGHLLFGQVFAWQNLVAYTIGAIVGVLIEWLFRSQQQPSGNRQPI